MTLTAAGAMGAPWTPTMASSDYIVRVRPYYGSDSYGPYDESDLTFTVRAVGDFDNDDDVDQDDFEAFDICFTGPGGGPVDPECEPGDGDRDGDVDCDDWAQFLLAWTGPGDPPEYVACLPGIPAVSEWGLAVLTLLMLTTGTVLLTGRRESVGIAVDDAGARGASPRGGPS